MEIAALSVFSEHWQLQATVDRKGPIQQWSGPKLNGQLFHVCLIDSAGSEIAATFFNAGVDRFYTTIKETHTYRFAGGKIIPASDRFKLVNGDLHINFDERAEIQEIEALPASNIDVKITELRQIAALASDKTPAIVNICVVVLDRGSISEVRTRQGEIKRKRCLTVKDQSESVMQIVLWDEESDLEIWKTAQEPLIMLGMRLRSSKFNDQLMLITNKCATRLVFNPYESRVGSELRTWLDRRVIAPASSYFPLATVSQLLTMPISTTHKTSVELIAFINYIRHDSDTPLWYESCVNETCKRRVTKKESGFHCSRCELDMEKCVYRYCASVKLCDYTDGVWVSAFNDTFEQLIGIPAGKAQELSLTDPEELTALLQELLNRQFTFTIVKTTAHAQEENKVRFTVEKVQEIDQSRVTNTLLAELERI